MNGTSETHDDGLPKNINWLPENAFSAIAKMVVIGFGLVIFICLIWWLFCCLGKHGSSDCEYVCRKTWENPPWLILSGLAAAPSILLTWYWRTRHRNEEVRIAQESQLTGRFVAAVQLLAARNNDARVGGIYGLRRIAKDSPPDKETVVSTLSAFVLRQSGQRPAISGVYTDELPEKLRLDIKIALRVLAQLGGADFQNEDLEGKDLHSADLAGANFASANLAGATLYGANLQGANLEKATISDADFRMTQLVGANLWRVGFLKTRFTGATFSVSTTTLPAGLDPEAHGLVNVEEKQDENEGTKKDR